jgi:Ca2+-binding RTX toxin-like protein
LAFTTVTGSDGVTSLVGTTGTDAATIVSLNDKVFIGGDTGNDTVVANSATGNFNLNDWDIRMGGGNDGLVVIDNVLNSSISLDGLTLANDGNDVYNQSGFNLINSTVLGLGGNDTIGLGSVQNSEVNGNAGNDSIVTATAAGVAVTTGTASAATILGGQGVDVINVAFDGSGININGNIGDDFVTLTGGTQGTISATTLNGGQGNDSVVLATNTIDGNTLSGDLGSDTLTGAASNDILLGGQGNDLLNSAAGADTLTGGDGIDAFTTGNGNATTNMNGTDDNFATITDFVTGAGASGESITVNMGTAGGVGGVVAQGAFAATSTTDLFTNLAAATGGGGTAFDGTNRIQTVTLTGGDFAGTYIMIQNTAAAAAFSADDVVIAANISGLVAGNITLV